MSLRIGVIGIGVHGLHHVRLLSSMKDISFAGVYDIDSEAGKKVACEFQISSYDSLDHLIDNVDCMTVAVPTSKHRDVVMHCLEKGKSVLVEKPVASNVSEAMDMIAQAEKRGLVLAVGHLERFNPAYRSVGARQSLKPAFIESHRLAVFNPRGTDVAVVLDLMIHDIDVVLDMVKKPVKNVNASGVAVVTDEVDIANARIEFEGGCVANLTASRISQKKMRKIRTFQKNSYISMDFLTGESEIFTLTNSGRPEGFAGALPQIMAGISYNKITNDGLNALELELADFIAAVRYGKKPCVTGNDGMKALEVASMIMRSMEVTARSLE
ncbi:MAG: Gfo/Idh/MocA family oxidoreductase [Candidatus Latescibacteria bacterium]|nr:Gfo/Idh/MocA family oxidoreductase [Candidatus Latescibacterota bacterium]